MYLLDVLIFIDLILYLILNMIKNLMNINILVINHVNVRHVILNAGRNNMDMDCEYGCEDCFYKFCDICNNYLCEICQYMYHKKK